MLPSSVKIVVDISLKKHTNISFLRPFSKHFIFFVTYEQALYTRLEMFHSDKHSSVLDPFMSSEEIEVL
jgi:hypothetical protein